LFVFSRLVRVFLVQTFFYHTPFVLVCYHDGIVLYKGYFLYVVHIYIVFMFYSLVLELT